MKTLAVWLNGNVLVSINEVALHRARLIPGWVTIFWLVNYLGHPGLLSLAIPLWVDAISISESWEVNSTQCEASSPYPWSRSISSCLTED